MKGCRGAMRASQRNCHAASKSDQSIWSCLTASNCSLLQILLTPVGKSRDSVRVGIKPFSMRATAATLKLLAAECAQFPRSLAVSHGIVTTVSSQSGLLASGSFAFAGNGRPRSS